jgi:PAS domain S-box-containing protein
MTINRADVPRQARAPTRDRLSVPGPGRAAGPSLDDLPDVVVCTGPDGVVRYASAAAVPVLGRDPACLVGRHAYDFLHPDDVLSVARVVGLTGDTAAPATTVHRVRRGDGGFGWYETALRVRRDPRSGEVHDVVSLTRDASVRVATERSLADSALQCRTVLEAQECGVVVLDGHGVVAMANAWAERLLGVGRAGLVGSRLADVVPLGDETGRRLTAPELACAEAVLTGQPCSRTVTISHGDGPVALLQMRARPLRDAATGRVSEVVLTVTPAGAPHPPAGDWGEPGEIRARVPAAAAGLTPRELEVLVLLARGRDITAAAGELGVTVHTVRGHVKSLLAKLGAHSQVQAVVTALRRGILTVDR